MMKPINTLMKNPDGQNLPTIVDPRLDTFSDEVKAAINFVFDSLKAIKPAWHVSMKTSDDVIGYKKQLGAAMSKHGINSLDRLNFGLDAARVDPDNFMPSVGRFASWCIEGMEKQAIKQKEFDHQMERREMIEQDTFAERQAIAKPELQSLRDIVKKNTGAK